MIAEALVTLCKTSSAASALGLYNFGSGPERAVFGYHPPPKDDTTCITVEEQATEPWDTRAKRGVISTVAVRVVFEKGRSSVGLRSTAVALWQTLHRASISIAGWDVLPIAATFPVDGVDENGYPQWLITCTVHAQEA